MRVVKTDVKVTGTQRGLVRMGPRENGAERAEQTRCGRGRLGHVSRRGCLGAAGPGGDVAGLLRRRLRGLSRRLCGRSPVRGAVGAGPAVRGPMELAEGFKFLRMRTGGL